MSQFAKVSKDGNEYDISSQRYDVGTYVCIQQKGRLVDQFGIGCSFDDFLKSMIKDGFEVITI